MAAGRDSCAFCGQEIVADAGLCGQHSRPAEPRWAAVNRIMCDLVHRRVVPARLSPAERHDRATDAAAA